LTHGGFLLKFSYMESFLSRIPEIERATPAEKLAMIDELWESVRRSDGISVPESHLLELGNRVAEVSQNPGKALSVGEARALFRK